jgi:hypothetical protein
MPEKIFALMSFLNTSLSFPCNMFGQKVVLNYSPLTRLCCINIRVNIVLFLFSKTPIEILHTILLGPVKYLLSSTIKSLNQREKDQLHAKISALDLSAFAANLRGNITRNYGSYT